MEETPGIELDKALALWRDRRAYQRFLRRFAEEYADVPERLRTLERAPADALLHKFKGASASMSMPVVAACAAELERQRRAGEDGSEAFVRLQAALATVLDTIHRFAPEDDATQSARPVSGDTPA